jgi:hypothetical protein
VQFTFDHNKSTKYTAVRIAVPEKGSAIRVDALSDWINKKSTLEKISILGTPIQTGTLTVRLRQPPNLRFTKEKKIKLGVSFHLITGNALNKFMIESVPDPFVIVFNHLASIANKMRLHKQHFITNLSQMIRSASEPLTYDLGKFTRYGGCFKLDLESREVRDRMQSYRISDA